MTTLKSLIRDLQYQSGITEARGGGVDEDAVKELELYFDNDRQLYDSKWNDYYKNLVVKKAQGKYDSKSAEKLFMYFIEKAARKYAKEFSSNEKEWSTVFSKPTREQIAKDLVDEFESEFKNNPKSFEKFIPKKYKGNKIESIEEAQITVLDPMRSFGSAEKLKSTAQRIMSLSQIMLNDGWKNKGKLTKVQVSKWQNAFIKIDKLTSELIKIADELDVIER